MISLLPYSFAYNSHMAQVEQIKAEIEALSPEDFTQLREWLAEKDWGLWDEQLEKTQRQENSSFCAKKPRLPELEPGAKRNLWQSKNATAS